MRKDSTILVSSGSTWAGFGSRSVDSAIREVIRGASSDLHLLVYSASRAGIPILDLLEPRVKVGIRLTMVVNRVSEISDKNVLDRLHRLSEMHADVHILSFEPKSPMRNLHAKTIVADREVGIIGSANLSRRGLFENYEMGVLVTGTVARDASLLIDRLVRTPNCAPIGSSHE